jgi:2-methylcitrate dehydratase PrpD
MSTIAEQLADFATGPSLRDDAGLGAPMVPYALDTLAVILAGSAEPSSRPVVRTVIEAAGKAEAILIGHGQAASAWDAALVNGAAAHALELDDDHRIAVLHPGAVVAPAALAAAEAEGASGTTFLRAMLVGYEVMCRLGQVFRGSQFYHGVHPTSLCGVFGAAAAAAVAMGLDRETFVNTLGIAGTQASGLTEWRTAGTWIKRLHPGRAAQTGVLSARLARNGFTGPATIFEGEGGFFRAYSFGEIIDAEAMTRDLGRTYSAFGTAIKPYPCCRFGHGAIDLAIAAHQDGLKTDAIAGIGVRIYRTDVLTYHSEPKNPVDAQFNLPYMIAVALLRGRVGLEDFTEEAIRARVVRDLCAKVAVTDDPEFTADYPDLYKVELTIDLRDESRRTYFSDCPNGDPEAARYRNAPQIFHEDVRAKVASMLAQCGFGDRVAAFQASVEELPSAASLDPLCDILRAPAYRGAPPLRRAKSFEPSN